MALMIFVKLNFVNVVKVEVYNNCYDCLHFGNGVQVMLRINSASKRYSCRSRRRYVAGRNFNF